MIDAGSGREIVITLEIASPIGEAVTSVVLLSQVVTLDIVPWPRRAPGCAWLARLELAEAGSRVGGR